MKNKALSSLMVVMLLLSGCLGLDGTDQQTPDSPLDPATETNEFDDSTLTLEPEPIPGCTRPGALNFDATANLLDDSCVFRVSLNDVLTSIGSVIDSAISFSSDEGIGVPFEISNEKMQISASSMGNGSVFVTMRHSQSGLTNVLYDLHDSHVWCTNAPDTSSFDQNCYSGNNLPAGVDPITSWMASQVGNIWGDAPLSSTLIEFQKITDLLHTLSSVTDLEWTEALGATVQKQVFLASTDTSPTIGIEVSVNPTTARVSSAVVSFNDSTYMFSQYTEYDGSAVPDSQRLAMQIEWHGEIGRAKSLDHCVFGSNQFGNANYLMYYASEEHSTQGPFMIEYGDPISSPDEIYSPDCSLATGELLDEESLGGSVFVSWYMADDDEPAEYYLFYLADNGRAYHDSDESRSDCDGGEDDFTQGITWGTTYSTCWHYAYDWSFVENYTQTEYDWHTYQHCEWDAEWEDWVCTNDDDHSDYEFHEYWFYCEHDPDRDIWFCTDDLGQSPDHEFTDGNEFRNQGQIVLGDYFCTLSEHYDDQCFPLEEGDYEVVDSGFGKVVMGLETTTVLTVLCMDGSQLNHDQIGDMVADCLESIVRGISVPSDEPYAFVCGDGSLILQGYVNDGWEDCTDGSDEGVGSHPDRTPELPAIYWDCWAEGASIQLMKSDTRPSEESYYEAIQSTEIPDWCGQELSPYWKHYLDQELEPSQSTMENLSGPYWFFHEEYTGSEPVLFLLNADGTSEQGISHYSEEECEDYEEYGLYWSEEYDICMGEAEDWSADEQMMHFFYGQYRFEIQDSILRIVPPAPEDEYSGGPEEQPVRVWDCYNQYYGKYEVYLEDNTGVPSEQRIDAAQQEAPPSWCGAEVGDDLNSSFSSDSSSESAVVGDYWYNMSWDGSAQIHGVSFTSDMQIMSKQPQSSLEECSEEGGTYDPVTQVCTTSTGLTWSANQKVVRVEYGEDSWDDVRYELTQNGSEVYFWNGLEHLQYPDGYGFEDDDMENNFYDGYYEVGYHEYQFTAEVDGEHVISSTTDVDGHLYLYFSPFDPEDPLSNIIVGQHYWSTHSHGSRIEWDLVAGVEYVIVTTPHYSDEEMQFQNEITDPSDTQWSWAGAIDDSTPRYTRPDGYWVDPPIGGPTFNCHDSMATVPLNRTLDGFADCHDASDEGWSLPMVASGMVASSDMGSLADLEIRLFLGSGSSLQFDDSLVTTEHYTNGTATAVAYHWSEGLTCVCEFVFMDADGDGAVSSGDWWTFWIWEGSSGWAPDDQLLLIDHVLFFDLVAEEHV